jgi:hypothetical protein
MFKKNVRNKEYKSLKKEFNKNKLKDIIFHKHNHKQNVEPGIDQEMLKKIPQLNESLIVHKVALVVNGRVADIIICPENLANILTGNVTIKNVPVDLDVKPGWYLIDEVFEEPEDFKPYIKENG